MNALPSLLEAGWVTGLAAAFLIFEIAFLAARRTPMRRFLFNTVSGLALIGALHASLVDWGAMAIAGFLALAFLGHLGDLASRLASD